ncbi:hypothetical protein [Nocardia africana]|uniref:Uncharacterized protein n=1 Tax=Nocardia africana TaxID=134964 RepID=A0A378WK63_9NOCA|nr:hypothetical protein [Nocardia africana]MCC3316506.1 hypothetical protein [Nocardia africana]SUA41137.1 Uncharacterised protein [Nocardia africana]
MSDHTSEYDNVIDLHARRRCQLEARGLDPVGIAVNILAETGTVFGHGYDPDGGDWAA